MVDAAGLVKYMDERRALIYLNGGSEESPAEIARATRYVLDNPFPGHDVECRLEILCELTNNSGELYWGTTNFGNAIPASVMTGVGGYVAQLYPYNGGDSEIVLQTGDNVSVVGSSVIYGNPFNRSGSTQRSWPIRARIRVWRIN